MPYCTNCGRKLEDGEICSCTASPAPEQTNTSADTSAQQPDNYNAPQNIQPYNGNTPPPPYPNNGGQPFPPPPSGYRQGYPPQQPYYGQPMPPKKESKAWILAIVIPLGAVFLLIMGIIAAIFIPAMMGYNKKSKMSQINSNASTLYRASSTALTALDEDGRNIRGYYIISSDKAKNVGVPFDVGEFYEYNEQYFDRVNDYDYFIVCKDGYVEYAAISKDWNKEKTYIGSYPVGNVDGARLYDPNGSYKIKSKNDTLKDVYNDAVKKYDTAS